MKDIEGSMPAGIGEEPVGDKIIRSILGEVRLAEAISIAQQQSRRGSGMNRSDKRISFAPREANMFWRRAVLEAINLGLQELNERFPGEKLKPESEQDPTFREERGPLLVLKKEIAPKQREERGMISEELGSRRRDKKPLPLPL